MYHMDMSQRFLWVRRHASCYPNNNVKAGKEKKSDVIHTLTVTQCTDSLRLLLQPFYGSLDFVWDNPGEPVPEETFTHSHLS